MRRTMKGQKKIAVIASCVCVLAIMTAAAVIALVNGISREKPNLARMRGVVATCDSTENGELTADKAIDGNDRDADSRWSSANNREDASHYIELEFPEEISVSFVILKWERCNAVSYALESSADGAEWEILKSYDRAPELRSQEIVLDEPARLKYLRLRIFDVSDNEEDYSNFYQNISLYEFEVYADKPAAYMLGDPSVGHDGDGSRYLVMPQAPEGYEVTYLGADYEQIIGADGTVYHTIQDKEVTLGFRVSSMSDPADTREVSRKMTVPSYDGAADSDLSDVKDAEEQERGLNDCPAVIPALAEWRGGEGDFETGGSFRVIVEADSSLQPVAERFVQEYRRIVRCDPQIVSGGPEDAGTGDFYLGYADPAEGLGGEGYTCDISDRCIIRAETDTGVRWGCVTVLQILSQKASLPCGHIRDYPLYSVRGFGIDVARKAVSLDMLYDIMETMSYFKMNDLTVHLNDNVILGTSGLTDTAEHAMTADSAFRLESGITNDRGHRLTSQEYYYTKEEFARFIREAKDYGVTVVPEIDTPAHSLAITSLYPSYALNISPETVDQIDLDNEDAVELVKEIWRETLDKDTGAFRDAKIVNIGMDEYYGDGERYRVFASQIADMVRSEQKTVRMWGSLSNMDGRTAPDPDGLQMNIWSTVWADPRDMYEAGYALVNMQNNHLYVIPGGGYDRLDTEELYSEWAPNKFYDESTIEVIPAYSPRMLGAVYMIWNDMSGSLDLGICEYDLYDRFVQPLPVLCERLWSARPDAGAGTGAAPDAGNRVNNDAYEGYAEFMERARIYSMFTDYDTYVGLEPSYTVKIRIRLDEDAEGTQVIARSDSAYGEWAFYAAEPETGRVGFAREGRTYTWDYSLPRGEQTDLTVIGEPGQTTLYVNGELAGTLGNNAPFEEYATFVFPTEQTGRQTGSFQGELDMEWE